jgi:hypothetical protein
VEAGARCGDLVAAQQALSQIAEHAQANPTPWALGLLARPGALLASPAEAETMYQEAIGHLETRRSSLTWGAHISFTGVAEA